MLPLFSLELFLGLANLSTFGLTSLLGTYFCADVPVYIRFYLDPTLVFGITCPTPLNDFGTTIF